MTKIKYIDLITLFQVTTFTIEKFGGLVGGFIGSLPTTTLASCLGIWFQLHEGIDESVLDPETYKIKSDQALLKFQRAMFMIPVGLLINSTFILSWKYVPRKLHNRFPNWNVSQVTWTSLAVSLVYWAILSTSVTLLHITYVPKERIDIPMVLGIVCLSGIIFNAYSSNWQMPLAPKGKKPVPFYMIVFRGLIAGIVVGTYLT